MDFDNKTFALIKLFICQVLICYVVLFFLLFLGLLLCVFQWLENKLVYIMYWRQLVLPRVSAIFNVVRFDVKVEIFWSIRQSDAKEGVSYWSKSVDISRIQIELGWTLVQRKPPNTFVQLSPEVEHVHHGPTIGYKPTLVILSRFQNLNLEDHV